MSQLTREQRYTISAMYKQGRKQKEIAAVIGKDKSVVSRELKRNRSVKGTYSFGCAQALAEARKYRLRRCRKFTGEVRNRIERYMRQEQMSPEQIVGFCKEKGYNMVSVEERMRKESPHIQVLINDAGMMGGAPFEEMELAHMLRIIDLNCKGATAITKVCLPYMVDGGTILEVSSTSAFVPNTNQIVYCASKSYLSALCLGLREELKHRKINVCAVCPGLMLTEMVKGDGTAELTVGQKRLPQIDPAIAAIKSLRAASCGQAVYTTGAFYKCYRLLAKLVPHTWLVKVAGLD